MDAERPVGSASDKLSVRCEGFRVFLLGPGGGMSRIAELFAVILLEVDE